MTVVTAAAAGMFFGVIVDRDFFRPMVMAVMSSYTMAAAARVVLVLRLMRAVLPILGVVMRSFFRNAMVMMVPVVRVAG
jgi:hypothetical protein